MAPLRCARVAATPAVKHVVVAKCLSMGYLGGVLVAVTSGCRQNGGHARRIAATFVARGGSATWRRGNGWGHWAPESGSLAQGGSFGGKARRSSRFRISVGTLYQKRYCSHVDLQRRFIQSWMRDRVLAARVVFEHRRRPMTRASSALGWLVVVLSVGAISLLYWLLRHGAASNVAGLFFLVPAATAVMAWFLFDERLDAVAVAGMVLISVGVALARQMRDPVVR
jgi:uncharacterized membrane protein